MPLLVCAMGETTGAAAPGRAGEGRPRRVRDAGPGGAWLPAPGARPPQPRRGARTAARARSCRWRPTAAPCAGCSRRCAAPAGWRCSRTRRSTCWPPTASRRCRRASSPAPRMLRSPPSLLGFPSVVKLRQAVPPRERPAGGAGPGPARRGRGAGRRSPAGRASGTADGRAADSGLLEQRGDGGLLVQRQLVALARTGRAGGGRRDLRAGDRLRSRRHGGATARGTWRWICRR